jgi:hypothetical protein
MIKSWRMRGAGSVAWRLRERTVGFLVGMSGGRIWEDHNEMGVREIVEDGMDKIDFAQDKDQWRALVNTIMNLRGYTKCWEILE